MSWAAIAAAHYSEHSPRNPGFVLADIASQVLCLIRFRLFKVAKRGCLCLFLLWEIEPIAEDVSA